ncbi:MAG: HepT-like ribonuclease domain-containing protein [Longimicrobiales bacterium]
MLDAARKAVGFTSGRSRADLDRDEQLALAVVRLLEIVGEAAKRVTEQTRRTEPRGGVGDGRSLLWVVMITSAANRS